MPDKEYILGIDVGTTSVKVCLVDQSSQQVVARQSKDTQANVPSELGAEGNKQDVPKIVSALHNCVSRLPKEHMRKVIKIGICGQMHGCLLWKSGPGGAWERKGERFDVKQVSHLYTWQDSRCTREFLDSLPQPKSHLRVNTGYGCATLLWMCKHRPDKFERFDRAGAIHDFIVSMICELDHPITSIQSAASWGYFDTENLEWNRDILQKTGLPLNLLPKIVDSGSVAGILKTPWLGIPAGVPFGAALGDLQCSVLSTLINEGDVVVNISTSAQISFTMPLDFSPTSKKASGNMEYWPYFNGRYIAVAASLNGGNTLAAFVRMLQQWTQDLGFNVPQSKIWEKVLSQGIEDSAVSNLYIVPTIFGERHVPEQNASVLNIDLGNIALGKVMRSLCRGVVTNLHSMMPRDMLLEYGIVRMIGSGSALARNKILQKELVDTYQLPITMTDGGDAAYGAAIAVL